MEPFSFQSTLLATSVASLVCWRAIKRKSLTKFGIMAAFAVGWLHVITGLRGFCLLIFYQLGTIATKYKVSLKATKDSTVMIEGNTNNHTTNAGRNVSQVLSCSLISTILSLYHAIYCGAERPIDFTTEQQSTESTLLASHLTCAIVAHHATCLADTLASEVGLLAKSDPVLITQPWRTVPSGTNGGITAFGTVWTAVGGTVIGLSIILLDYISGLDTSNKLRMVVFATCCGVIGSILDSILGATLQETFYDDDTKLVYHADSRKRPKSAKRISGINVLNNVQVNIVSVMLMTMIGGWVLGPLIFA